MLARRLAAYAGVMQARVVAEREGGESGARRSPATSQRSTTPVRVSDAAALAELDELGLID